MLHIGYRITLFSLYSDVTIFSYLDQSGSIFVFGGVTKKTKCSPVLSNKRLLAFSKGHNTKTASVGGSPKIVEEWDGMGGEYWRGEMGLDEIGWDGMMECEENIG